MNKKKLLIIFLIFFILIAILAGFWFWWKTKILTPNKNSEKSDTSVSQSVLPPQKKQTLFAEEEKKVSDDTEQKNKNVFSSDNYQITQMWFGGDVPVLAYEDPSLKLELFDIESEILSDPNTKEIKLLVRWKTNKNAQSELEYFSQNNKNKKILKEEGYGFEHTLIVSGLEPTTVYEFRIISKDQWGNESVSDSYAVYSGSGFVSIFDLISEAFGDVFGWMKGN